MNERDTPQAFPVENQTPAATPDTANGTISVAEARAVPVIRGFHAHVYFGPDTIQQARALCEQAAQAFPGLKMGRVHERPVGPHPDWSCQLSFRPELFGSLIPWLAMRRNGLVVFTHPISDNERVDHRDRAVWMGAVRPLDLSALGDGQGDFSL